MPVVPPTGVASELLQRRPDIQAAEYAIAAAAGQRGRRAQAALSVVDARARTAAIGGQVVTGEYPNATVARAARRSERRLLWPARALLGRRAAAATDFQRRPDQVADPPGASSAAANCDLVPAGPFTEPSRKSPTTSRRTTSRACGRAQLRTLRTRVARLGSTGARAL